MVRDVLCAGDHSYEVKTMEGGGATHTRSGSLSSRSERSGSVSEENRSLLDKIYNEMVVPQRLDLLLRLGT